MVGDDTKLPLDPRAATGFANVLRKLPSCKHLGFQAVRDAQDRLIAAGKATKVEMGPLQTEDLHSAVRHALSGRGEAGRMNLPTPFQPPFQRGADPPFRPASDGVPTGCSSNPHTP